MKEMRIKVIGKVQGVAFRYYTKMKADDLCLAGTVQNLDDGSVIIRIEGTQEKLDSLTKWCHIGSPASKVAEVISEDLEGEITQPTYNSKEATTSSQFTILRG